MPKHELPNNEEFSKEIVDFLFPDLNDDQKLRVKNFFDHAFGHPWVDGQCQAVMAENICRDHNIEVPEEFLEHLDT